MSDGEEGQRACANWAIWEDINCPYELQGAHQIYVDELYRQAALSLARNESY